MFYNANGLLMHNMVAGNFDYVQAGMPKRKKRTLSPDYRATPRRCTSGWRRLAGRLLVKPACVCFMIICVKNTSSVTVMRPWSNWKRVIAAEPYISLGRYIHVTAIKSPALAADARITYE